MVQILDFENTTDHCLKTLGGARSMMVTYKDMNEQPEAMVRQIMQFIGEPQDSLDLERLAAAKAAEVGTEIKKNEKYQPMFQRENLKKMALNFLRAREQGMVKEWVNRGHEVLS